METPELLPPLLYVQHDGTLLQVNRTAIGAMNRDIGRVKFGGDHVGIYELKKIVRISPGAQVIEISADPVTDAPPDKAQE